MQEALALHSKRRDRPEAARFTGVGQPLLEAQVADAADSLAYDAHDVDDALGVGLIIPEDIAEVPFWRLALERARRRDGELGPLQFRSTVVRTLIDWQVTDLLDNTRQRLRQQRIGTIDDVRHCPHVLVEPGAEVRTLKAELEEFLHRCVYQHYRVQRMAVKGGRVVRMLFDEFCRAPQLLQERYFRRIQTEGTERVVCDYLAGMTDRYALDEYLRLFQPYSIV